MILLYLSFPKPRGPLHPPFSFFIVLFSLHILSLSSSRETLHEGLFLNREKVVRGHIRILEATANSYIETVPTI